jgi:diaminopimelate decarboxylase
MADQIRSDVQNVAFAFARALTTYAPRDVVFAMGCAERLARHARGAGCACDYSELVDYTIRLVRDENHGDTLVVQNAIIHRFDLYSAYHHQRNYSIRY